MNQPAGTTGSTTGTGQASGQPDNGQVATRTDPPEPKPSASAAEQPQIGEPDGAQRRTSPTVRQATRLVLIAVALVVLGAVVSLVVALLLPERYAARTELVFDVTTDEPTEFLREDRTLSTQLVLIEGRSVLEPVAAAFGSSFDELSENVTARIVQSSKIIEVEVRDGSRERGVGLLGAINARYIETLGTGENVAAREFLERQRSDVRSRMTTAPAAALPALAEQERSLSSQLVAVELDRLNGPQARVVVPPYSVSDPVSPRPLYVMAAGALTALLIACGVVAFLARRWTRD